MNAPLTLADYQALAQLTDQRKAVDPSLAFPLLGLFGETGSLLSEVKKKQRDQVSYRGYQASVLEELGDTLWYLAAVADRGHIALAELGANLDRTLDDWQTVPAAALTFKALQPAAQARKAAPAPPLSTRCFGSPAKSAC
jgi:NTP pyrophosphatase (non-canonical NTP hydrolase)